MKENGAKAKANKTIVPRTSATCGPGKKVGSGDGHENSRSARLPGASIWRRLLARLLDHSLCIVVGARAMSSEPASERQIAYARDLGISFPDDISMSEMSILISQALRAKYPPPAWLETWATRLGVDSSRGPSREVFANVERVLAQPGNEASA